MRRHDKHFIYRIPLPWLEAVMKIDNQCRGQTKLLNLTLAIWYLYGLHKEIRISSQIQKIFHLSSHSTKNNLKKLESGGLIFVTKHRGRAPLVKLCLVEGSTSTSTKRYKRWEG